MDRARERAAERGARGFEELRVVLFALGIDLEERAVDRPKCIAREALRDARARRRKRASNAAAGFAALADEEPALSFERLARFEGYLAPRELVDPCGDARITRAEQLARR